ncbi:hypothetical protein [Pedobacter sp. L105]|uniref:hypothetical protein n=1 Tax=Pedobacter sp. L105 TaxID=1641871 RepID=UPI00131CF506|nr:hypothetical protein [Pedobacter sp. L105]
MDSNYELLISKINEFTRKFYLNKLLRGTIYTLILLLSLYLLLFVLIYELRPVPLIKTILFFSYLLVLCAAVVVSIIRPALAYFRLRKNLSLEESALLIGNHFQHISDKLLNTLQLKQLSDLSPTNNQLILAGIEQKITDLKPIPFSRAVNLEENKKYIKYLLVPIALIITIALIAPVMLREGTKSFVQYDKEILPVASFNFNLGHQQMTVSQGDDLLLNLKLEGDQLPQEVYLQEGQNTFKLEKDNISKFHFLFKNLQKTETFHFSAAGFASRTYQITVKPRPAVINMQASLVYPAYLKKKNEVIPNTGDLLLPEGTTVTWNIHTENTENLIFKLGERPFTLKTTNNIASFRSQLRKSQNYEVVPKNNFSANKDSIIHKIEVIADLPPVIEVNETIDSMSSKARYFTGKISDDHGFSALRFICTIKEGDLIKKQLASAIPIKSSQQENNFFYFWNIKNLDIKTGQSVEYYLEVIDNDAINGPKKTRSVLKTFSPPSGQQLAKQLNTESNTLKSQMNAAIKMAAQVEKDSKRLGQSLPDKKDLSFEDKKEISQLLDKQKKLQEMVQEIQQAKKKNTNDLNENTQLKADLADKQQKIDDLFNNVLDAKTKALLEKLQQLVAQNNKDQAQNELSKMNMDNKSLKNELDRMLELYKQLEFEQNLQDKMNRLSALSKTQKELGAKTSQQKTSFKDLQQEQEKSTRDFETLKKEMKELSDKNQALDHPNSFQPREQEMQQIAQLQQQSLENLKQQQQQKAAAKQQQAAEQMQQLVKKMEEENEQSSAMESNLNTEELRRLLQNILQTSFDQEKVMQELKKLSSSDPAYVQKVQQQREIKDNMKTIADSLSSLSKRIPQIQSPVRDEMQQINFNLDKSLDNLAERHTAEANKNQQYTMTGINNLALMLNEALEQLEKNQKNAKQGGKGKGKPSMHQLRQMQEQLNKNMQQAKQQMQQNGNKGTVPKGRMSEEFAKMAQQQQLIREALQQFNREENKDGKGSMGNLNQLVKDMKSTETDLINKKLEEETMKRQQALSVKLLDADKAEREQQQDSKRESTAARDLPPSYPKKLQEFRNKQLSEDDFLQKTPPSLNYYYKNKISDYFKLLNSPR